MKKIMAIVSISAIIVLVPVIIIGVCNSIMNHMIEKKYKAVEFHEVRLLTKDGTKLITPDGIKDYKVTK